MRVLLLCALASLLVDCGSAECNLICESEIQFAGQVGSGVTFALATLCDGSTCASAAIAGGQVTFTGNLRGTLFVSPSGAITTSESIDPDFTPKDGDVWSLTISSAGQTLATLHSSPVTYVRSTGCQNSSCSSAMIALS